MYVLLWRREGIVHENAQVFNNVGDLYGIAWTSSGEGKLTERSQPDNDIVAFGRIDRLASMHPPLPDIEEGVVAAL